MSEPAGYPSVDERISVRAREYFELIADAAYKDAIIEVLQAQLAEANEKLMTEMPRLIGFSQEE